MADQHVVQDQHVSALQREPGLVLHHQVEPQVHVGVRDPAAVLQEHLVEAVRVGGALAFDQRRVPVPAISLRITQAGDRVDEHRLGAPHLAVNGMRTEEPGRFLQDHQGPVGLPGQIPAVLVGNRRPCIAALLVPDFDAALDHIAHYGSGHSEAIITENYTTGQRFVNEVDAAAVYLNASTQFTDGAQFGLGAEVGISTQKLHARGPMALGEMTTYKWIIYGNGHTRP